MTPPEVDAVVFDYGGVLTYPVRDTFRAWMQRENIEPSSLAEVLAAWNADPFSGASPVHLLETGELAVDEFERLISERLTTRHGTPVVARGVLARAFAAMRPREAMFRLVRDLKSAGVQVALLSNSWGNTYPRHRIDELFDVVVISGEVGMRKPLTPIYELTLAELGLPGDRAVFVDDLEVNLTGAAAAGMNTIHHTDPGVTRAALTALIPRLRLNEQGAAT